MICYEHMREVEGLQQAFSHRREITPISAHACTCGGGAEMKSSPDAEEPAIAAQRDCVLHLVRGLTGDLSGLDLDTIDGEFYWRCCRSDLRRRIAELIAERPLPSPPFLHDDPDGLFAYFRQGQQYAWEFALLHLGVESLYPYSIWTRLRNGERVPMRPPLVFNHQFHLADDIEHILRVHVFSGAWTGDDVERQIDEWLAKCLPPVRRDDGSATSVQLRADFAFVERGDWEAMGLDSDLLPPERLPYIEVTMPFPPPALGVISREYDAVVRGQKQWHLRMPGAGAGQQEIEVAIRTWGVGLLLAAGIRFGEAMRVVCEEGGLNEVSQSKFHDNRTQLLERVPEAAAMLMQRQRAPKGLQTPSTDDTVV
jgi:hypothetical protein